MRSACLRLQVLVTFALAVLILSSCGSASHSTGTTPGNVPTSANPAATSAGLTAIGAGLSGPAGLNASVYAQGPSTVAAFAFDDAGRLWLTAAGLETHTQDGVYLIRKPGDSAQRVIAGLDNPLGILWYRGKLYIASLGRVDAYWGFNGTRFTAHRLILNGPLAKAENNLLTVAPNGRFLMGVSATCDHCQPTSKWDGAIVSFRPDGSDLRVYASRIRAPFGLTYIPGSDDLLVSMNQQDNLAAATPGDWLAIVKEGQDWRFPDCHGQGGAACVDAPRPLAELDKHAAVGGIAVLTGQLGSTVGTAALVAEWNVAKVQRVTLTKTAAGYTGTVHPFLTGIHNPLALALAPDGSLLVGDWMTGTIYRVRTNAAP
jgi:glucose/arabinose dehydrogenase